MQIFGFRAAVLVADELRNPLHRTGAVERDERDDVFEARGLELDADARHAVGFDLEDAHRFAAAEHLVGPLVVVGDRRQVEVAVDRAADLVGRGLHHREVAQAQEVHLEQADLLDPDHVELRVDVAVVELHQRRVIDQRSGRDHDAGRVCAGVTRQAFDSLSPCRAACESADCRRRASSARESVRAPPRSKGRPAPRGSASRPGRRRAAARRAHGRRRAPPRAPPSCRT